MPVNKINDGGKTYGSSTLAIKKFNGTTYVARGTYLSDEFSQSQSTSSKETTDSDEIPNGQITTRGLLTGKATLQFAASTTPCVEIGDAFKWVDPEATTFYFYVDSAERSESKGNESKQAIGFRRIINTTNFKATAVGGSESAALDMTTLT